MTSQQSWTQTAPIDIRPLPKQGMRLPFWQQAVQPGFYGEVGGEVRLSGNSPKELLEYIPHSDDLTACVYAVDTGGYSLKEAAALKKIDAVKIRQAIEMITTTYPAGGVLHIPGEIAAVAGWPQEEECGRWRMVIKPTMVRSSLRDLMLRLSAALRLWVGQAVLFSIPLALMGWQPLVIGLALLLVSAVGLAVTWPLVPVHGALKGLLVGLLAAGAVVLTAVFLDLLSVLTIVTGACATVISFWSGIVIEGVKSS